MQWPAGEELLAGRAVGFECFIKRAVANQGPVLEQFLLLCPGPLLDALAAIYFFALLALLGINN